MNEIKPEAEKRRIKLSLPSLRLDSFFAEYTDSSRKGSLTFAPEAGTQRLRDVINKNITEENIEAALSDAIRGGYRTFKLYFMIGLPTETQEDLLGIVEIVKKIRALYREITGRRDLTITVSTSVFIPKPLTPFQRERMISEEEALKRQAFLKAAFRPFKRVSYRYHAADSSRLECAMARGGRELSQVILNAYLSGCHFDAWSERFDKAKWTAAFEAAALSLDGYLEQIPESAELPWDFIEFPVRKDYLENEYKKAMSGITTAPCSKVCHACGAGCKPAITEKL